MGSIKKQPNGRWRARYRDPQGRSRSKTFDRRTDAERHLEQTGVDVTRGEWLDPRKTTTRFREWADKWWATTARLRPTTRRGYHQLLHNHVLPYFGGSRISDITYVDVEQFIADKLTEGKLGPKKVRDAVSVVSLVVGCAMRANARRDNPAAGHHVPIPRRRLRQGDVLTMTEIERLVACAPDQYRPAIWLLVFTGMRPAELCGLRVSALDLARSRIHIRETLLPVSAYGDQRLALVAGPPKTAAGDRSIPIPHWLRDEVLALLERRQAATGTPLDRHGYIFVNSRGTPLNRDKFRELVVRPALLKAGLPASTRTYDLRHAHASLLIDLGANVLAIAQRMGHSDPSITLRVYGHLFNDAQDVLSEKLDALRTELRGNAAGTGPPHVEVISTLGLNDP